MDFAGPTWEQFSTKNWKGIQKGMQKSMPKKYWKVMPKGYQNDAKMETKIFENSCFSEKGWNARNFLFYKRKRGSGHLKVMKKHYRIDAKSMLEKGMPKVCKRMPKGNQHGSQNPSEIAKIFKNKHAENDTKNWYRKRSQKYDFGTISIPRVDAGR